MDVNFAAFVRLDDRQKADYVAIRSLIATGGDLSRFYRASKGPDYLLKTYQVLHLHLGGPGSNAVLYVVQYRETVLFVTIDTHRHLDAKPPGGGLNPLGRRQFEADVRAKVEAANKQLLAAKARLIQKPKLPKPEGEGA